jgi:membrane fusion protein (multidrug efflux system)
MQKYIKEKPTCLSGWTITCSSLQVSLIKGGHVLAKGIEPSGKMRRLRTLLFVSILVWLIGCNQVQDGVEKNETITNVTVIKAERLSYIPKLKYSGTLIANKEANLGAALPGRVEKIYFEEGQDVEKGKLIAELSGELLTQAHAEFLTLQKDYERFQRLRRKGIIPQQKLDQIEGQYEASKAKYQMMKKNTEIRAPFTGTLVERYLEEGENFMFLPNVDISRPNISLSSGIVTLMQLNPLKVRIEVNEKDISKIHIGQSGNLTCDAYPDKIFQGRVSTIKPILSAISRSNEVEITFANPKRILKPGMFGIAILDLPRIHGIFIPRSAVLRQTGTGEDYVFVAEEEKAKRKAIKQVGFLEDKIAIKGIKVLEQVIVGGKNKVINGARIKIISGERK